MRAPGGFSAEAYTRRMSADRTRAQVLYTGWVQGVGFRWRTCRVADEFDVTGWVRNRTDGRVELVAEGATDEVQTFLASLAERMDRHIEDQEIDWGEATGEFRSFDVRR